MSPGRNTFVGVVLGLVILLWLGASLNKPASKQPTEIKADIPNHKSDPKQVNPKSDPMKEADEYCMKVLAQPDGPGLCDQAIDRAVGQVSGKPSAYDMCTLGYEAGCKIALETMRPSDPRYDEVWTRVNRPQDCFKTIQDDRNHTITGVDVCSHSTEDEPH
jgi:hypothetical protein